MEEEVRAGFISAHRRYMRATLRVRKTRNLGGPAKSEQIDEQREAGKSMVEAMREAQIRETDFREFYAAASEAIGESDPFVLLDWDEANEMRLGVRLYELEYMIQEEETKHNAKRTGMEVFLESLAAKDGLSRDISELFKRHAHILWQLVRKGFGFNDIMSIRSQALQLTAQEVEELRRQF